MFILLGDDGDANVVGYGCSSKIGDCERELRAIQKRHAELGYKRKIWLDIIEVPNNINYYLDFEEQNLKRNNKKDFV